MNETLLKALFVISALLVSAGLSQPTASGKTVPRLVLDQFVENFNAKMPSDPCTQIHKEPPAGMTLEQCRNAASYAMSAGL